MQTQRLCQTLVLTLSSKLVLICRLLTPLKPPDLGFSSDTSGILVMEEVMRRIARFLSMIPLLPKGRQQIKDMAMFLTCHQFLNDFGCGSQGDHAVLLCNYFMYLGKRSALLLGEGVPEGKTVYVIVWDTFFGASPSTDVCIWNPVSGVKYSPRDPFIPLTCVTCIVFNDNVSTKECN